MCLQANISRKLTKWRFCYTQRKSSSDSSHTSETQFTALNITHYFSNEILHTNAILWYIDIGNGARWRMFLTWNAKNSLVPAWIWIFGVFFSVFYDRKNWIFWGFGLLVVQNNPSEDVTLGSGKLMSIFHEKLPNICWFPLLKLLFFSIYDSKLNIVQFWAAGQVKQASLREITLSSISWHFTNNAIK